MRDSSKHRNNTLSDKFLEGLNFELRTLLNGFVGPVQLLKLNVDDPGLVEVFRMLDSSLSRLERLAIRTSIVQNPDSIALQKQQGQSINLVDLVKYCILDLQTISDLENITFSINNDSVPANINGNYDLLLQAFEVLFELAISLSESDTTIGVDFALENQRAICRVTSPTASFPAELNLDVSSSTETNSAQCQWDILLAKAIIEGHEGKLATPSTEGDSFTIEFSGL
jgi:signal transduction histidine kinase